ncbi:MAG TPA: hypothetical protein VIK55_01805 [Paludibacter sp.]
MIKDTPIINILTYNLPYKLANQIYNENESRFSEVKYLIDHYDLYKPLSKYIETVKILLAMTIFQKRVIANLDAAIKFHGKIKRYSNVSTIKIGSYDFTEKEKNKLYGLIINFNTLINKFGIPIGLNDYEQTKDFLNKVLSLLEHPENDQEKGEQANNNKNDLPF